MLPEYDGYEYDPVYEKMWKDMAGTVDEAAQDEKMRQMEQYLYDRAYAVFIYSPLNLYAVNKEVNFVPQKSQYFATQGDFRDRQSLVRAVEG